MFASSGRARIAYDVTGAGSSGCDVLLMHAGVTDRRSWSALRDRLDPRHRCIAFDARQYGETAYEREEGWSNVQDALAVMDDAGSDQAVVVAASMGGANALDLAILHPERVTGLALIGTALHGAPEAETYEEPIASVIAKAEAAYEAADWAELNRLEAWIWLDGAGVPEGRVSGPARDLFLDMNGRVLAADDPGEPAPTLDARARVGEIAAPTLILVGRLDLPEIIATDAELAERIPSAQLEWLADTAHLPHLEGHEVCLQKVSDFVDAVAEGRVSQGG